MFWVLENLCIYVCETTVTHYMSTRSPQAGNCGGVYKRWTTSFCTVSQISQLHNMEIMIKTEASHHPGTHNDVTACFHLERDLLFLQQPLQHNKCGLYSIKGNHTVTAPVLFL